MKSYRITVDDENNADEWWAALDTLYPTLAATLRRSDSAVVYEDTLAALRRLPGWADGPEYARHPLIVEPEDTRHDAT